jgi:putative transposase
MTNHVHLLLKPLKADGCALLMKHLGQRYCPARETDLPQAAGTLWEGRFRSCLVPSERTMLAYWRIIEHNPLRTGMASYPRPYW